MIAQTSTLESQIEYFRIMIFLAPILALVFLFYGIFGLKKYLKSKSTIPLYFSLSNFAYTISMALIYWGIYDLLESNEKTVIYFLSIMVMNIFIVINAIFFFLFHGTLNDVKKSQQTKVVIVGIGIILFHFLPQNGWFTETEGFKLMYLTFLLMAIFSLGVYTEIFKSFLKLSKEAGTANKSFKLIAYGAISKIMFFIFMLIRVAYDSLALQLTSFGFLFIALLLFFFGFIQPKN